MQIGGPISEVSIDGRGYTVAADNDANRQLGGYVAEVKENGDGSARKTITPKRWEVSDIQIAIDDSTDDHEFINNNSGKKEWSKIDITLASGVVLNARGSVIGETPVGSQDTLASISLAGPGQLTKQS